MKKTFILWLGLGFLVCCGDICHGNDLSKKADVAKYHNDFVQNAAAYKKLFTNAKKIGYGYENLTANEWHENVSKNPNNRIVRLYAKIGDTGSIAGHPVRVQEILGEKTCRIQGFYADGQRTGSTFFLEGYPTEELIPYLIGPGLNPSVLFIIGEMKVVGKRPVVSHGYVDGNPFSSTTMYPVLRLIPPAEQKYAKEDEILTPEEIAAAKLAASFRTWTFKNRKGTFDAMFLSFDKQTLTLEDRDGNEIKVKASELIKEDIAFYKSEIERLKAEKIEALTRMWTIKGAQTEAVFVSTKSGKVTLRSTETGVAKSFSLALLSPDDREWIEELLAGD